MVNITGEIYSGIAKDLAARIASGNYFNGRIEYDSEEYSSALTATLIIYRQGERITDVVPVWWEFSMMQPDGEVVTDFSWRELRDRLLEYL